MLVIGTCVICRLQIIFLKNAGDILGGQVKLGSAVTATFEFLRGKVGQLLTQFIGPDRFQPDRWSDGSACKDDLGGER